MILSELDEAWRVIRQARGLGIELRADLCGTEGGRVLYRPQSRMLPELFAALLEHRAAVMLILDALATPIPPDASPGVYELCRFCGSCRWMSFAAVWQCRRCYALWRPLSRTGGAGSGATVTPASEKAYERIGKVAAGSVPGARRGRTRGPGYALSRPAPAHQMVPCPVPMQA